MARKRNTVLKRAWDIIALSIIPMTRVRKHIKQKLLFKNQRLKLLRHYNYAFIGEYEFSPSSTPSHHLLPMFKKRNHILSFLLCGSHSASADRISEEEEEMLGGGMLLCGGATAISVADDGFVMQQLDEAELTEEEDESVDGRADRFIEKFYEEMRIQRQESIMHYREQTH